jgi:U1 small nuclear ribonucleoprotein C
MSVRKAHNAGRNHLRNVVEYYQQIGHEKAQSVIDSITSSYAESGQANPMLPQTGPMGFGPPPGFPPPLPGKWKLLESRPEKSANKSTKEWYHRFHPGDRV